MRCSMMHFLSEEEYGAHYNDLFDIICDSCEAEWPHDSGDSHRHVPKLLDIIAWETNTAHDTSLAVISI